jgi:quercetin dioxygenase-like cupin family protein
MDESAKYFQLDPETVAASPGRYVDTLDVEPVEFVRGLVFRPVLGEELMVNYVSYEPHTDAPRHAHAEEQILLVVEGELEVDLGEERRTLKPGQLAVIPPFVPHAARTHEGTCVQVDIFHPPRQALLDLVQARGNSITG